MSTAVSILIPTYNYNAYPLVKALAQQADHFDADIEILVFDDGSETKIEDHNRLDELPRVSYKYFDTNSGRSSIRRSLCEAASHDWLLFLDSDTLPKTDYFLQNYLGQLPSKYDVICGGIAYEDIEPSTDKKLRYHYGKEREAVPAAVRCERPFLVFTGNLFIKKDCFKEVSTELPDFYGEDLVISQRIRDKKYKVLHINNPVYHLGLESSEVYLEKVREMVTNVAAMEKKGELLNDLMKLQNKYQWLKRRGMLGGILWYFRTFESNIVKNLLSAEPNMRNLDLFKLYHYHKAMNND